MAVQGAWSTGLLDCTSDCSSCFLTCCCPCISFGRVAEIVDRGNTSCFLSGAIFYLLNMTCCSRFYLSYYRKRLRNTYNLPADPCNDCLVICFCEACAMCQHYRELKHRGFDLSVGWDGNVAKNQGLAMPPNPQGGMTR